MHRRLAGHPHRFQYGLAMYRLDLGELPALDAGLRLFGVDRKRPVSFWRSDHLADVRALLRDHGVEAAVDRVELVTNCRVLGYVFNPVSFFLCYAGSSLAAIVCEVHNTFGESHAYVLKAEAGPRPSGPAVSGRWQTKKVFHVSPFFTLDGTYRFDFEVSAEHFEARIDLYRGGNPQFVSRLALDRRPLTDRAVAWSLVRYPFVTAKIIGAIHWEALRLWWKGAPYHPRPPYDPESARHGTES